MKFSLVHPSRGRLERAEEAILEWRANASGRHPIEHILGVDADDPDLPGYRKLAERHAARLVVGDNRSIVDATNRAARAAEGDVLIVVSDDFGCPPAWDAAIAERLAGRRDVALYVNDGLGAATMTLPILGRDLYQKTGFAYHPDYISMFADNDITEVARRGGALVMALDLVFPHRHCSAGHSAFDATYARQNAMPAWWHGWRVYHKRRIVEFGFRASTPGLLLARLQVDLYYWLRTAGSRVRQHWLRFLPPGARRAEAALRARVLRLAQRAAAVDAPG